MALPDLPAKLDAITASLATLSTDIDTLKAGLPDPTVVATISTGIDNITTAVAALITQATA